MSELSIIIADEIQRNGPITMARFMELALYCPVYGYYERDADNVGKRGDFLTSVSVGSAYGELLASRFALWLDVIAAPDCRGVHIVEAGAHDGQLALDILSWLKQERPDRMENLQYHLIEPSNARREWQRRKLREVGSLICWSSGWKELRQRTGGICGIIFSNEILDALPVHRVAWDRERQLWFEWLVNEKGGSFVWSRGDAVGQGLLEAVEQRVPRPLQDVLPDGYVVEICPAAIDWWGNAARSLSRGWLMTMDYGFDAGEEVMPERTSGTLRAYHLHQAFADVLQHPGERDITAHVHFGPARSEGERIGLRTEFFGDQSRFLTRLLIEATGSESSWFREDPGRLSQIKTLIHPDHFGRAFKVLVQTKV
jgi:SAM-dependent MidA family methyltransferase